MAPRAFASFLLLISAVPAIAQSRPAALPSPLGFDPDKLAQLDGLLRGYVDRKELPGPSVLVARCGKVVYEKPFGLYDLESGASVQDDTILRIYSISQAVTAAAVMAAYEGRRSFSTGAIALRLVIRHLRSSDPY